MNANFESAKDNDSIPIEGQSISIGNLKERIFDPSIWDGYRFRPQDCQYADKWRFKIGEDKFEDIPPPSSSVVGEPSLMKFPDRSKWDVFGNDLYTISEVVPVQSDNAVVTISPANKVDEDIKIKALVDTPALVGNHQGHGAYGIGRGLGRGRGGRTMYGSGFGPGGGLEDRTPPAGHVCHRCEVQDHFIEHCPMNADYNCHAKRVKPPTGILKSVLQASRDVSYALPSGAVAVLKPNEAAFEKEIEGLPSTWSVPDVPPELQCPLCKEATKDAVFTSKCCFSSFCDKCIRDYIISKSMCVCGATNILADDLLPNKNLRESINLVLKFATSSTENAGCLVQLQDMESACPYPEALSPTMASAASRDVHKLRPIEQSEDLVELEVVSDEKPTNVDQKAAKNVVSSNPTPESVSGEEPPSQESTPVPDDHQEKLLVGEQASGKQWRAFRDIGAENFARMPMAPSTYNSCWAGGMPMGMDGYMSTLAGAMPYIGCIPGPFDVPFGGLLPQDPFGGQGYILPLGSQREHSIVRGNGREASSSASGPSIKSKPMKDDQSDLLKHGNYGAVEDGGTSYEKSSSSWNSSMNSVQQLLSLSSYNWTSCDPNDPTSADATGTTNVTTSISPRRRRKKLQDKENVKRCNCKKSKCLKLYCECLAAGVFCAKACACQECYNITDYEDLVSEVRQRIESRNPNAFTPKVIVDPVIHNDNGGIGPKAPVSPRHRRGCNCKKSHCMKKYCECYQASVRCSYGCRCEGCGNTYGRKDVGGQSRKRERGYTAGGGFGRASFCSLSPNSPLQQSDCDSMSTDGRRVQFLGGYYPPEESSVFNLPSLLDSNSQADQASNQCSFTKERLLDERTAISTVSPSNHSFQSLGVAGANANANWSSKTTRNRVLRQLAIQGGGCATDAPVTTSLNKVNKRIVALECAPGGGGLNGSAYYDAHVTSERGKENRKPTNTNGADANPFK